MKKMFKLYPILLIILGSFLEIYYYSFRFSQDGVNIFISISIAIALTIFLTMLSAYYYKKITWLIIIPLALFSIITTSAGQAFSLGVVRTEKTEETAKELIRNDQIEELQIEIKRLNNEYDSIENQKNQTITALSDRWEWKNTLARAEERQLVISEEKKILQEELKNLRLQQSTHEEIEEETTDIYKFYNNLFGINSKWLQFILQSILSLFIALMAPFGIITITSKKEEAKKEVKEKINFKPYVTRWVTISWTGNRKDKTYKKIMDKTTFLNYWKMRFDQKRESFIFPEYVYDKIKNTAIKLKCVDKKDNIVNNYTEDEVVKTILNKLN